MTKKPIFWKNIIYLKFAGFNFKLVFKPKKPNNFRGINNLNIQIQKHFLPYISGKVLINISHKLIFEFQAPRIITHFTKKKEPNNFLVYYFTRSNTTYTYQHISLSQFLYVFMNTLHILLVQNHGFIVHASSVIFNNKIYAFLARPGGGKTTTVQKIIKNAEIFSDDAIIIRRINKNFYCFQAPLDNFKPEIAKNPNGYEIGEIFFVKKNLPLNITIIEKKDEIFNLLANQLWTIKITKNEIEEITKFIKKMNFYWLERNIKKISPDKLFNQTAQLGPIQ